MNEPVDVARHQALVSLADGLEQLQAELARLREENERLREEAEGFRRLIEILRATAEISAEELDEWRAGKRTVDPCDT